MSIKGPPAEAWEIITKLHEQQGVFSKFFGKSDPRVDKIDELEEYLCPGIIQHISFLLFDSNIDIAQKAGDMITSLLGQITNNELIQLDEKIRGHYEYQYSSLWEFNAKDIHRILRLKNCDHLIGLCSFFPNGYLREAALKDLIKLKNEKVLKYILLRLNDWVASIRIIAKTDIIEKLSTNNSRPFINLLDIVERMSFWGRDQHSDIIAQIEQQLTIPENENLVVEVFRNPNFRVRRFLVRILSRGSNESVTRIIDLVKEDNDLMVRFIFLRSIQESISIDQAKKLVDIFKHDKLPTIKRLCAEISVENKLDQSKDLLETLLFDNSKSVRELSRWYLKKEYEEDNFRSIYLAEIDRANFSYGCICGLGEVGQKTDANSIVKLLDHKRVKVRKATFLAISNLNPDLIYDHVLKNISTESPSMIKCMAGFIADNFIHYSKEDIWELMLNSNTEIVKTNLFIAIISKATKWEKLRYLLRGAEKLNKPQIILIYRYLIKWSLNFNRSFNQPSASEIAEIESLINDSCLDKEVLVSVAEFLPKS